MDHILQHVVGIQILSMIDGFSGYNQIAVQTEGQEKKTYTMGNFISENSIWTNECRGKFSERNGHSLYWGKI